MTRIRRINRDWHLRRRGVAHLWVIFCAALIISVVGFTVDLNLIVLAGQELQVGADAAALAAVNQVRTDQDAARAAAVNVALQNRVIGVSIQLDPNVENLEGGEIVIGRYNRDETTFTPTLEAPNAVKVVARRLNDSSDGPLQLLFGDMVGVSTIEIQRTAIAMIGGGTGAGMIALNNTDSCAITVRGTTTVLDVQDGAMQVNSSHTTALCHSGQPTIYAEELNVNGGTDFNFESQVTYDGAIYEGQPQVPDPLAFLPEPTYDPADDLGTVSVTGNSSTTVTLTPGYYSGGISMNNNFGAIVMEPGIYVLDGAGLDITGGNLLAEGVMIYIIDTTPDDPHESHLYLGGNGDLRITPPDPELYSYPDVDTYEGVSIFQARDNTNDSTIIGTNTLDLEGTLYFPNNHLNVGGEGDGFGNQLIADTIEISGTGTVTIQYDGRFPAVGNDVFLVY